MKDNFVLCSIYDRVAQEHTEPKMFANEPCARRWFQQTMKETHFEPEDFELWFIGEFDSVTGNLIPCDRELLERGVTNG